MNWKNSSLLIVFLVIGSLPLISLVEESVPIDAIMNILIIVTLIIAGFVGTIWTDEKIRNFYLATSSSLSLLALSGAIYNNLVCTGLACLLSSILLVMIPVVFILIGLGTLIARWYQNNLDSGSEDSSPSEN